MTIVDGILREMSRTTDDRIVIVSNYTQTLDILAKLCKMRNYGYIRLDGDTAVGKRQGLVDKFNDSKTECMTVLILRSWLTQNPTFSGISTVK